MTSIRKAIALSLALGASLATSLPAAAIVHGGILYDPAGPVINVGNQHYEYVAWMRRNTAGGLEDRHIVTMNWERCLQAVNAYISMGWQINPNQPGGVCHSYLMDGNAYLVDGNAYHTNPVTVIEILNLSDAVRGIYQKGVRELRQKYQLEAYELEHDALLRAVKEVDGEGK